MEQDSLFYYIIMIFWGARFVCTHIYVYVSIKSDIWQLSATNEGAGTWAGTGQYLCRIIQGQGEYRIKDRGIGGNGLYNIEYVGIACGVNIMRHAVLLTGGGGEWLSIAVISREWKNVEWMAGSGREWQEVSGSGRE